MLSREVQKRIEVFAVFSKEAASVNRVLSLLPREDYLQLMDQAQEIQLPVGMVLYESNRPIEKVYFPLSGLASVVTAMDDGTSVEVLIVGRDGMVGLAALESPTHTVATRAFMQVPGHGLKLSAEKLRAAAKRSASLQGALFRYFQFVISQISQCAACNRIHNLEERLSRWLLMVRDRMDSDEFALTHEFLAQMLGTRRASVSLAAATLKHAGLIKYSRGRLRILDKAELEQVSCECYSLVKEAWDVFHKGGTK